MHSHSVEKALSAAALCAKTNKKYKFSVLIVKNKITVYLFLKQEKVLRYL